MYNLTLSAKSVVKQIKVCFRSIKAVLALSLIDQSNQRQLAHLASSVGGQWGTTLRTSTSAISESLG